MYTKDGFHKALEQKLGDDAYLLLAAGGHKKLADLLTSASLGASGNSTTLSVTVGGTTKSNSITVPYASKAGIWETERILTIGSSGKSVNGSKNVTWTLDEIGVYSKTAADDRYVNVTGDTMTGALIINATGSASNSPLAVGYDSAHRNINTSVADQTTMIQVIAGTGGSTNSSAIGFHNPGISSAVLEYRNTDANTGSFNFRSDNTTWRIGIGTTSPAEKLDVNGDIRCDHIKFSSWSTSWRNDSPTCVATYVNNQSMSGLTWTELPQFATQLSGNLYWANVSVSTTSSTTTEPTFKHVNSTGAIRVGPTGLTPNNGWDEGIRLYGTSTSGSWSKIDFGCELNVYNSSHSNQWSIGRNPNNKFFFGHGTDSSTPVMLFDTNNNVGIGTASPSHKLHVEGNELVSGTSLMAYSIKILPTVYSELKSSYGLSSDYESRYDTEEFLKSWVKYAYANGAGYTVQSYISPNSRGFIIADVYASGINSSSGYPEHITGRYYPHGGGEIIFGTSYGSWYYRTGYDDSYHPRADNSTYSTYSDYTYVEATSTGDWMYPNFTYYGNTYRREYVYNKLRFQPSTGHLLLTNGSIDNCPLNHNDGADRPGISILGSYPQLDLIASVSNSSHGATINIGAYDSAGANSGSFKAFRIGTRGYDATWLDLAYGTNSNPHEGIDSWNPSGNGLQIARFHNNRTIYNYGTTYFGVASYGATYYHSGYTVYSYDKISHYSYTYGKSIIGDSSMWNWTLGVNGRVGIATNDATDPAYLNFPYNTFAINFRPGGSWTTGFYYGTYGNEFISLVTQQSVTSIIFANGYAPNSLQSGSFISGDGSITYGQNYDVIQIKQNCMNIGSVWTNGVGPDYKLKVNGSIWGAGSLIISQNNSTGGGIILADDGDIVDLNDAYCSMRFSYGVRIFSANRGGSPVITLKNNGVVYSSGFYHNSYGSSNYFLTSDGGARYWPDLYDGRYLRYEGWWTSGSGQNVNDSYGMNFTYPDHGAPHHWGTTVTFECDRGSSYRLQLHGTGDNYLYFRNRSADYGGWHSSGWKQILTNQDTYVASDGTNRGIINGTEVASARHLLINGVTWNSDWHWSGQGGQPSWLWGSNDGANMYVWNPSNFSVNYANSAGSASTINSNNATLSTGNESNPIYFYNGGTVSGGDYNVFGAYGISSSQVFSWYSTQWHLGNIRGGSTDSVGFGINYGSPTTYTFVVTPSSGVYYQGNRLAYASEISATISKSTSCSSNRYVVGTDSTSGNFTTAYCCSQFYFTSSGAYHTSDIRKKYDIRDIYTDEVTKLFNTDNAFIRHFKWKESNKDAYGFIAQELQEYCPEAVDLNNDTGYYAVNYNVAFSKIIGAMYKRVKQLENENSDLKLKIEDLYKLINTK